ncbi:PrsW family intramembrane metalloprotease [Rhodococcus sp. IEGM 1401]|uniref:PrsW family intramembrane metalloprotease n=1 Tax=unclassified Rhodococcus (in: high G+C Gram-positive bacteria) TaxID=192944 RepID=UPI0022B436A9|nr:MULTISPECIES: PrsW family intramembrane metalloprotease [unclassified Rhodococcus (in: high G+C Gram-positive bacteria)]MCZ4562871.1 PrsW family intramembrane metalloprotease [Rhodococcus sp. IEGM 1401]MDI9922994.1 PrsW family intramembrane metalloprotease [Rhodococcus sp. IEGM 1372]MDV8035534.1 PrsW family intramembrane metalloprotease [Rhodococcus sp. IEGM 1414]
MSTTDTSAVSSNALRRQKEAIEISGWGERFHFVQPHNLSFWVYLALTAIGAFQAWAYYAPGAGFYAGGLAIAAVLCGLGGLAWFAWFRHIDRWERQPGLLIAAALWWGAIPATFAFAMTVNTAMLGIYSKLFGQEWSASWAAGATAPFTEEAAKLCGFILLMSLAPRLIRTANDGLIVGAFIGLGFAVFEDFLYAANSAAATFGTDPVGNASQTAIGRIAASFVSHPLFSALVCAGALYLIGTAAQPRRIGRGLAFVVAGMLLHFTWDDATGLGFGNPFVMIAVMFASIVIGFTILTIAFRKAAPREHQFVRDILAPEVEAGTLTDAEIDGVLDRRARKEFQKSAPNRQARRARKHLRRAILDLAHDIADAKGNDTEAVQHSRAEVERLRARDGISRQV